MEFPLTSRPSSKSAELNQSSTETASTMQESVAFEPVGTRGSCSFIHNGCFHVYSGCPPGTPAANMSPPINIDTLDIHTGMWSTADTKVDLSIPNSTSGACCTVLNDKLYVFGGWLNGRRNSELHELDLESLKWRQLIATNRSKGPICKDKAGMFTYGDEMVGVFGGYGYPDFNVWPLEGRSAEYKWDPSVPENVICWTNELHLFHIERHEWIVPVTSGPPPPACAAFSLTRVDPYRLVLFGGKQWILRVRDVHILDLDTWHWSGVQLPSRPEDPWPLGRSFHTACTLVDPSIITPPHAPLGMTFDWLPCPAPDLSPLEPTITIDPKILILWGMDNRANPFNDAWELNVKSLSWKKVNLPQEAGPPRAWHTASVYHPSPCEAVVMSFGGTPENMMSPRLREHELTTISSTAMFYCGVRSLLQLCLELITEDGTLLSLTHKLPRHLQQQIKDQITNTHRANINRLHL